MTFEEMYSKVKPELQNTKEFDFKQYKENNKRTFNEIFDQHEEVLKESTFEEIYRLKEDFNPDIATPESSMGMGGEGTEADVIDQDVLTESDKNYIEFLYESGRLQEWNPFGKWFAGVRQKQNAKKIAKAKAAQNYYRWVQLGKPGPYNPNKDYFGGETQTATSGGGGYGTSDPTKSTATQANQSTPTGQSSFKDEGELFDYGNDTPRIKRNVQQKQQRQQAPKYNANDAKRFAHKVLTALNNGEKLQESILREKTANIIPILDQILAGERDITQANQQMLNSIDAAVATNEKFSDNIKNLWKQYRTRFLFTTFPYDKNHVNKIIAEKKAGIERSRGTGEETPGTSTTGAEAAEAGKKSVSDSDPNPGI